jgi:hypothetical protein
MGGEPYVYFAPYEADINSVLQKLRKAEFEAGRYGLCVHENTGKYIFEYSIFKQEIPANKACHESIEAAINDGGPEGTGSILDIERVRTTPFKRKSDPFADFDPAEFLFAAPVNEVAVEALFGTKTPTKQMVKSTLFENEELDNEDSRELLENFWEGIGRGQAVYLVTYEGGVPSEVLFVGFSLD